MEIDFSGFFIIKLVKRSKNKMKWLNRKISSIWMQKWAVFQTMLVICIAVIFSFGLLYNCFSWYMTLQALIVCLINLLIYFLKFYSPQKNNLSIIETAFFISTLCGLGLGFMFGIFLFEPLVKLLKYLLVQNYYWSVLIVFGIINIAFSEFFSCIMLKILNFLTSNSLYIDFEIQKPDPENAFNRLTFFFGTLITGYLILSTITNLESYNKTFQTKVKIASAKDLKSAIFIILIELIAYVVVVFLLVYSLVKSEKISKNYSELWVICIKNLLTTITALVGLYTIFDESKYMKYTMIKLLSTAIAAGLYPLLNIWKYVHDEIRKEKQN